MSPVKVTMEAEESGRTQSAPQPVTAQPPNGSNKILGRNANGTMIVTSAPSNEAELTLYRVMQRASLLAYYDTLVEMGGDDVQQLCEAGEEEFLEIMSLVGMATKPLHVRRLQKTLQEFINNPSMFTLPMIHNIDGTLNAALTTQRILNIPAGLPSIIPRAVTSPDSRPIYSPSPGAIESLSSNASAPKSPIAQVNFTKIRLSTSPAPLGGAVAPTTSAAARSPQSIRPSSTGSSPSSITSPPSTIQEAHIQRLAETADALCETLPQLEPKPQNTKKKNCKNLEMVMKMSESDPRRMDEIRKYAAIYGRFDCKRKPEKALTFHEILVNEAAAQVCRCIPALLTRRDELFPLARQVVRKAGLHYSKHAGAEPSGEPSPPEQGETPSKRLRQEDPDSASGRSTSAWWGVKTESDDADSRCSYSSASSPQHESEELRPHVVAARGDSIIAVANPALLPQPIPALIPALAPPACPPAHNN